jgi:hypothetical protein
LSFIAPNVPQQLTAKRLTKLDDVAFVGGWFIFLVVN